VHATAVTASQSMPAAASQLSVCTMVSCYNCCMHSLWCSVVHFVLVYFKYCFHFSIGCCRTLFKSGICD